MNQNTSVTLTPSTTDFSATRGDKNYELNNHLGSVLVTVSDQKIPHPSIPTVYTNDMSSSYSPFTFSDNVTYLLTGGRLKVTVTATPYNAAAMEFNTITGHTYKVTSDVDLASGGMMALFSIDVATISYYTPLYITTNGTYSYQFTAIGALSQAYFENSTGAVRTFYLDNVKIEDLTATANTVDYYTAKVVSATDYYSFGAPMPGRSYSSNSYRYGFDGKEKLDEMHGNSGDAYDFGDRIYDPRIGRWLATDPFERKFPSISPYVGFADNPIYWIDKNGDYIYIHYTNSSGKEKTVLYNPNHRHILNLNSFVCQTEKALNYEYKQDPHGIIGILARDTKGHDANIYLGDETQNYGKNSSDPTKITYDPHEGLAVDGGIMSSAQRLFHEIGHKFDQYFDKKYDKRRETPDEDYGTKEDKFVEEKFETPTGKALGEPTRNDHGGQPTSVPNSTYHIKTDEKEFQKQVDQDYPDTDVNKKQAPVKGRPSF